MPVQRADTGLILGRVVDGTTGEPIAGAEVLVGAIVETPLLTDRDGRFVYFNLPAGSYRVLARKAGYANGEFGRRWTGANQTIVRAGDQQPSVHRLPLADGERRGDVIIRLWKHGAITGRIVDEAGEPVIGALVQAWPRIFVGGRPWLNSVTPAIGRTDDRGIYRIPEIVAGDYVVAVPVLSATTPAAWQPTGRSPIAWHPDIARVGQAYRPTESYESVFPTAGGGQAVSAGAWLHSTMGQPAPRPQLVGSRGRAGYRTMFYPGVFSPSEASTISVAAGRDHTNIDLQLQPVPVCDVFGTVTGPYGPAANVGLRLTPTVSGDGPGLESAVSVSDTSGGFAFLSVAAGSYLLDILEVPRDGGPTRSWPRGDRDTAARLIWRVSAWTETATLWARQPLTVGAEDLHDVHVELEAGARISGTVTFVGASPRPAGRDLERILELDRPDGRFPAVDADGELAVNQGGEFRSIGLPPGRYLIRAPRAPSGWTLQTVMFQGRDRSVVPLELGTESVADVVVTFTDRPSELAGTVRTLAGVRDSDATVMVFPSLRAAWTDYGYRPRQFATARVDVSGRYVIRGLPPGDYLVAAVDDVFTSDWHSPRLFDALARVAERVRIGDGAARALDLTTRKVR